MTRRELLTIGFMATAVSELVAAHRVSIDVPEQLTDELLIEGSGFSGERLSRERVRAARVLIEFHLQHFEALRRFNSDEEPLTTFRL
jgi:hypothetical protein